MPFAEKKLKQFSPILNDGLFNCVSGPGIGATGLQPGTASIENGAGKVPIGRQARLLFKIKPDKNKSDEIKLSEYEEKVFKFNIKEMSECRFAWQFPDLKKWVNTYFR